MEEYIRQLRATCDAELYYFSLIGCMTLIDTCAAINSITGETSKLHFKDWFNRYLPEYVNNNQFGDSISFSADECYKFRCRLLHQGRTEMDAVSMNTNVKSGKIAFRIGTGTFHCCNFGGVFFLDIKTFMEDLIQAVFKWIEETKDILHVIQNFSQIIKTTNLDPSGANRSGTYIS